MSRDDNRSRMLKNCLKVDFLDVSLQVSKSVGRLVPKIIWFKIWQVVNDEYFFRCIYYGPEIMTSKFKQLVFFCLFFHQLSGICQLLSPQIKATWQLRFPTNTCRWMQEVEVVGWYSQPAGSKKVSPLILKCWFHDIKSINAVSMMWKSIEYITKRKNRTWKSRFCPPVRYISANLRHI